jgi:segregation and condensation protein B
MTMADDVVAEESAQEQLPEGQPAVAGGDAPGARAEGGQAEVAHPDGVVEHGAGEGGEAVEAPEEGEPRVDLAVMEALMFSAHHPVTAGRIAELLQLQSTKPIRRAIKDLNQVYADTGRSFRVEQVAGGYQLLTLPEYGDVLQRMHQREADTKLTKSALETLAIVAYKQPILRADVEAIRGVACGETIRSLMEKHLVKIAGRAELPGRPILYGTTKRFLELFGLNSLKDLPQQQEQLAKASVKREEGKKVEPPAAAPSDPPAASGETPAE